METTAVSQEILEKISTIYADNLNESVIPLVKNMAGLSEEVKVVAETTIVDGHANVDVKLEYVNKFPDAFDTALRYIFEQFFNMTIERIGKK